MSSYLEVRVNHCLEAHPVSARGHSEFSLMDAFSTMVARSLAPIAMTHCLFQLLSRMPRRGSSLENVSRNQLLVFPCQRVLPHLTLQQIRQLLACLQYLNSIKECN